jgi:hypothetical protein
MVVVREHAPAEVVFSVCARVNVVHSLKWDSTRRSGCDCFPATHLHIEGLSVANASLAASPDVETRPLPDMSLDDKSCSWRRALEIDVFG